jgi:hypothetical protein
LRGIDPQARYEVLFTDENRREHLRGEELAGITVAVSSAPGCSLIEYAKMR